MSKFSGGTGSLTLFSVQGNVERELQLLSIDRIREKLGLEKVSTKKVGNFDLPVIPSQEDFFMFPFRLLSKTVVGSGSWKATDFSKGNALKESVSKVAGKVAYLNHDQYAGREIGFLGEAEWVDAYTLKGESIPAGIEGPFVLDSKIQGTASMPSNADLIRKLSGPAPMIKACSMSVEFEWHPSHDFEKEYDFWYHIGEEIDGSEVRRIVDNIEDYGEGSLVYQGADPFAKKLDDKGNIITYAKMLNKDGSMLDIDKSSAFAKKKFGYDGQFSFDSGRRFYIFDSLDKENFLTLSRASKKQSSQETKNFITMNEELLLTLATLFGVTADDIKTGKFDKAKAEKFKVLGLDSFAKLKSEEDFNNLTADKKKSDDALIALQADKKKVDDELALAKTNLTKFEPLSKIGENIISLSREEAKRVYGLSVNGKTDKVILDELDAEMDLAKIDAKIKLFGGTAVTEFGGVCADCGCKDINFRSSSSREGGKETKTEKQSVYGILSSASRN